MRRDAHVAHAFVSENCGHCLERSPLAVHHEGSANGPAESSHPRPQLILVRVCGVPADRLDLGAALVVLAQDTDDLLTVLNPAAQGVLRLKAYEQNQVAVVADAAAR